MCAPLLLSVFEALLVLLAPLLAVRAVASANSVATELSPAATASARALSAAADADADAAAVTALALIIEEPATVAAAAADCDCSCGGRSVRKPCRRGCGRRGCSTGARR